MALVSVNGNDVVETSLNMPRSGAWTADLLVDDPDAITGAVTIAINVGTPESSPAMVLSGTVVRSGVFLDAGHVRVVAGAAGLGVSATPRHYQGPTVRTVLADLLRDSGETLAATSDSSILASALDAWTTTATPVGTLLSLLLAAGAPGASWRMLADGTLWVGRETWPDAGVDSSLYQIFEDSAESGTMLIGVDAPFPLVGTTFEGRKVSRADYVVAAEGGAVETRVWFEDATPSTRDRLKDAIARLVRAVPVGLDFRARYFATVVSQSGATVDVQLEPIPGVDSMPDMAGVPLLLGIPGASVDDVRGGRVLIGWAGADPSRPYAEAFDVDASLTGGPGKLVIAGGSQGVARVGDAVSLTLSPADVTALAAAMVAAGLVLPGTPSGSPPPAVPVAGQNVIVKGSEIVKVG